MSDQNRGAYTPQSESPLAFDARRRGGPAPKSGNGALIFSGIILLVLIAAVIVFTMTQLGRGGDGDAAASQPEPYEAIKTDTAATPPASGLTVTPVESLPPPVAAVPLPVGPVAAAPVTPTPVAATPAPKTLPVVASTPAPKAAPVAPAPVAVAPVAPAPTTTSSALVQIGAFSSSALAERDWNDLAYQIPVEMVGKTRRVEPVQDASGTRYRSLVGGFATRDAAVLFCNQLKARGRDCLVR